MDAFVAFVSRRPFHKATIGFVVALACVCLLAVRLRPRPAAVSAPVESQAPIIAARPPAPEAPPPTWKLAFELGSDIWIANGDGTGERRFLKNASQPCWSPDRKQIAFVRAANVWVADAAGANQKRLTSYHSKKTVAGGEETYRNPITSLTWEPHSNRISYARCEFFKVRNEDDTTDSDSIAGSSFYSIATDGSDRGKPTPILETVGSLFPNLSAYTALAWSPSGKCLAFVSDGDIWVAQRGERRHVDSRWSGKQWNDWEWDVSRLAAVAIYDQPNYRASTTNMGVTRLCWSPDGQTLANGMRRLDGTGVAELHLLHLNGEQDGDPRVVSDQKLEDDAFSPCFSPDGSWLVFKFWGRDCPITAYSMKDKTERGLIVNADGMPAW